MAVCWLPPPAGRTRESAGHGRHFGVDRFLLYRTYDELEVGQTQRTRGRTITETDIVSWCALTGDWFYPHIDKVAAERSMFGQRVAPGIMVFALGSGLGVPSDATTILANYGTDRLRYTAPTWINDTIYLDIEVIEKSDRWQRNLRRPLELLEDGRHPAGAALVMCARRILRSDPHDWDELVAEAAGAERYSRRLSERITDGYAAKFD